MNPLSYLPSKDRIGCVMQLVAGLLVGWLLHPLIWIVAGPFRWVALMLATASQESGYNPGAVGDQESQIVADSVGVLQFANTTWTTLTGRPSGDRTSPFLSGYYAAAYVSTALLTSWSWWQAALPIWGFGVVRVMWTNGIAASTAERLSELVPPKFDTSVEGRGFGSWILWRGLSLVPAGICVVALWRSRAALARLGKRA